MGDDGSFKSYITIGLLVGLCIMGLFSFSSSLSDNYDKDNVMSTDKINFEDLEETMEETSASAEKWQESFTSDNVFVSTGALIMFSLWGVMKLAWSSITSIFTIYFEGAHNVLGLDPLVTGVLTAILIIGLIFSAWRLIVSGQ